MTAKASNPATQEWAARYPAQWPDPGEALQQIRPGRRLFIGTGCAMPQYLVREMVGRACTRVETGLLHILTLGPTPFTETAWNPHYTINSLLMTDNVREAIRKGHGQYSPIAFSDLPRLLHTGELPLEAALIQVSPPDSEGLMSLGVSVDVTRAAVENARLVIAQVNSAMPRTAGNSLIHVHDVDYLVEHNEPLVEYDAGTPPEEAETIGGHLAALVDDGATIAAGLGRLISAVLPYLGEKKELGIHTELLTSELLDLIDGGAATGARKTLDPHQAVASFAMGDASFYERLHEDKRVSMQPTEYVNDPAIIARHTQMTSISSATQVDLTGQVCADSIGSEFHSGVGGIMDFNRGAARSRDGKPIVVMSATAQRGAFSRVVTRLSPGAGATTTRADVHYVVTEFGTAFLHGKSVQERALSLISLAHPRFREQLLEDAISAGYVQPRMASLGTRVILAPRTGSSAVLLSGGVRVRLRAVQPTDEAKLQRFIADYCRRALFPGKTNVDLVFVDHRSAETVLATVPAPDGEEVIAFAAYQAPSGEPQAEAACMVAPPWPAPELAPALLQHLATTARAHDIDRLLLPHPDQIVPGLGTTLAEAGMPVASERSASGEQAALVISLV